MRYTITLTHPDHAARTTVDHIADAIGFLMQVCGQRINYVHVVTDVAQIGEYLECVGGVWVRVTRETMH